MTVVADSPSATAAVASVSPPSERLRPEHYEPTRVPAEVRRHAGVPDTLGVGRPGKIGLLELGFEHVDCVASVADALRYVRTHVYAAAIVDMRVKDGDSSPAAMVLAANGVPLVIASGYTDLNLPAGLTNVPLLSTPYYDEELAAALNEAPRRANPHP